MNITNIEHQSIENISTPLSEEEYRQIIIEWNATTRDYPYEQCLHQLIEAQVEQTPDATALIFEGAQYTYRQLNEQANQLAFYLKRLGVGPEVIVGVALERSFELVTALVAILKAGGSYVPLDPDLPADRLAFILEDLRLGSRGQDVLVLTQSSLAIHFPEQNTRIVPLDTIQKQVVLESTANLPCSATSDNLAYVIYTSGSTGKPKGALNTHRGICNRLLWMQDAYRLTAADCVMQKTPFSFDVSVWEFFWPLMTGARLAIARPGGHKDSAYLLSLIRKQQVTTLHFVPSMLQIFLEEPELETCTSLRQVICSGEALPYTLQERFFARHPATLHNLYGPTEAAIDVTSWTCQREGPQGVVPIGRPIANTQIYILDPHGQPVPVNAQGELYIGGIGVARGYLNRPELTTERFLSDPFTDRPDARLYRTGDLARYLPDGTIMYLGRVDNQVKLRGFRIELGEIEAVLGQHPAVRETVVIVHTDTTGDKRLVAYVVMHKGHDLSIQDMQRYMARQVPDYMIPATLVALEAFPLNTSGKVARNELPAPAGERPELAHAFVAPRTPAEVYIAGIWSTVLGIEQVGVEDDFFTLGGHSLLAMQIASRLRETFGIEITLRAILHAPTVTQLAALVTDLAGSPTALSQSGLPGLPRQARSLALSAPGNVGNAIMLPASFAQQNLWFLDQMTPWNAAYNIPATVHIRAALDPLVLRQCFQEMVQRHETLRTTFALVDEQLMQVIAPALTLPLAEKDFRDIPHAEREMRARHWIEEEAARPFDLANGPLLRLTLLHLDEQEYVLVLVMHHCVSDGWSISLFFRELSTLSTAFAAGLLSPLPELPAQYADFAVWQRERVRGTLLETQLAYWRRQLADAPPTLELPLDYPRPATFTRQGATYIFDVPGALTEALKAFSQREGVTLYTTLVAAFLTLLYRHSGQDDLVIGTAIAERQLPEVQGLLGIFLNTLALRVDFSDNPATRVLLQRVHDVALDAYANQDVPFELLVQDLHLDRSASQNPLFQVALMLDPPAPRLAHGWTLTRMVTGTGASKFDLSLELDELPTGLVGHLEYSTDLFDESTIVRMAEHWQVLLAGMVADPAQPVAQLPLLTVEESHQLFHAWNQAQKPYPRDACLHQLFTEQAERTPQAIAAVFGKHSLTYGELNTHANQLAHYLQTLGVGADTLVAICIERSLEMLVGLLAILKAGGAYVPLDPTYPAERLAFMLEDAGVAVLLTQQDLVAQLPVKQARVVCLDTDVEQFAQLSQANPTALVTPENLCYIIYTSGSTGRPKGVQIPHRAVVNFLHSMSQEPGFTAQDRLVAVTTLSFDIAGLELYLPLLVGARLFIASREEATSGTALAEILERSGATMMQATPITWRILLANNWHGKADLKALCGGEALSMELVRELLPRVGSLYNMYGPTETTIWSTLQKIEPEDSTISIGRPIANTSIAILDKHDQPAPIGVIGELYIGGDGLAQGYLNRPELTAERFLWLTFAGQEQKRLYRTGDLARYRTNGTIELIGRVDHQIKLRGFRIELGEIEAVLAQHSTVQQAVALVREDIPGDQRLVAYILPRGQQTISTSVLRQHALKHLPNYMVPSALVILEQFPQTPNGKVDRRALPVPEQDKPNANDTFVAPRTELEEMIASVWTRVLGVAQVGIHENFFALGGHSLLALQAAARLRQVLDVELSLRQFFDAPTIARQAEVLSHLHPAGATRSLPALLPQPRPDTAYSYPMPASPGQQGLWFLHQMTPQDSAYNIFATVRLHRELHLPTLAHCWQTLVERHEALRTTFAFHADQPVQRIAPPCSLPLSVEDLRALPAAEREDAALVRATHLFHHPFDLAQGPLARLHLFQLTDHEHVLLLVMHHSISDGWSLGLLLRELTSLYDAQCHGQQAVLPPLPAQFADVVAWQTSWMQGVRLAAHLDYWQQTLAGAPTLLHLPTDHPRVPATLARGAQHTFHLPASLTTALKELGMREQVTLYMLVLAAFQEVLHRYTDQHDFLLGTTTAGRTHHEVEPVVGYFVNTLVLRADLTDDPTGHTLLQRVRESVLNAQAHQELPFDLLVKELQPAREVGSTPLFQVFLTQDPPLPALAGEWDTTQWDLDIQAAKFDLALDFSERAGAVVGHLEYRAALFEPTTIARMARHLEQMLHALVAHPEQRVSACSLLSAQERTLLLQWNQTANPYPEESSLHALFAQQVARTPHACAVSAQEGTLSYQELNARANQVAHTLLHHGVQPGARVGICLERSLDLLVGLLAILKSGAAYVPLDPGYPQQRLAFLLEDAQLAAVLTHEALLTRLPLTEIPRLCLDRDSASIAQQSQQDPPPTPGGEACAYLIYTSGSTGTPKGVLGTHRATLNRFSWMWQTYPFTPGEVCCQKTTLGFVDAVWEIFGPLLQGVRLHLFPDLVAKDPRHLVPALAHEQVSRLILVPSLLRALLDSHTALGTALPRLRYWICSGEALPLDLARRLHEQAPQATLLNLYGSSEVAADATCYEVRDTTALNRIPIGRPIANTQVYVLDQTMQPVPIGLVGELHVGGAGLALGYFQRPELTDARFVPDPFSATPGARLYKTGDQARFLEDGTLEYLGRRDHQVKVRGVRIELGEIEAVLGDLEGVEAAVVTVREDTPGDQRLVAYLVPQAQQALSPDNLRPRVAEVLPAALVPSHWVVLSALPLLPNGKVNRLALPAPEHGQERVAQGYVAPETALQYQLATIWEALLRVQPVGIHEDFFALGGHSLLAVRLMGRIADVCGRDLPLSTLFQNATIAKLARVLQSEEQEQTRTPLIPVHASGTRQPFFYLHGDPNGKAFYSLKVAQELGADRPFYLLEPYIYDDLQHMPTLQEVAAAHIEAMRRVQPEGPYVLGGWCNGAMVAYEMAQQLQAAGQEITLLVLMDPGTSSTFSTFLYRLLYRKGPSSKQKKEQQDTLFFRLLHMYEYVRLWGYRRRLKANASLQQAPEEVEIAHPNFTSMFPPRAKLRDNYMAIFNLLASGYQVQPYNGKIAVFWAEEDNSGRRKTWSKLLETHQETTTHFIPGTHMTSRTRYAHVLGRQLSICIENAE